MKRLLAMLSALVLSLVCVPGTFAFAAEDKQREISFEESVETISNPGMGYTSTLSFFCKPGSTPVKNPTAPLVLMFVNIGGFSSGINGTTAEDGTYTPGSDYPLDDTFFASLRETFENCRQNGCTIGLRFRYDDSGIRNPEPATFEMMLSHIQQIDDSGILEDYKDILMYVESGFVGCYGEQWGGKYCSMEKKAQLLDLLLDVVPDPIPVTVRTPNIFAQWAGITVEELGTWESPSGSEASRVGLYNDGYMGSNSDLGTFSNRERETAWLGRQTLTSYYGGEFSGNLDFAMKYDTYLPENAIPEMYQTHLSYINGNIFKLYQDYTFGEEYAVPGVDLSAYYGQTVFQFIRDHLGYRFVLRASDVPQTASQGSSLNLGFSVENTGFANPIREQKAELILERDGDYLRTQIPIDSREWRSAATAQENLSVSLPGCLEPGDWNVYLKLSVGDNTIDQIAMRSVRFANEGIWEPALGANYLGTVEITETRDPKLRTQKSFGDSGKDTVYTLNGQQILDGQVSNSGEVTQEHCVAVSESGTQKFYVTNDERYLYLSAEFDAAAEAPVHNIQFTNADNGIRYWIYYQSNGFVYFNQGGTPEGCLEKSGDNFVEIRIPLGDLMGLEIGTKIQNLRYSQQDSSNDWVAVCDLRTDSYTLTGDFAVYTVLRKEALFKGETLPLDFLADIPQGSVYQWLHDGVPIENAEAESYIIEDADADAVGLYSVEVTTPKGTKKTIPVCEVTTVYDTERGDCDGDGTVSVSDAIALREYLLAERKTLANWAAGDMNGDSKLTATDFSLLKARLLRP